MRSSLRDDLAHQVNRIPYSQLLKWGITRCGDVTGLDIIGIPVYTSTRPPGKVITISAGKGMRKFQAKAGAILEAVELWSAENPDPNIPWYSAPVSKSGTLGTRALSPYLFHLAADAPLNSDTVICYDEMDDLIRGDQLLVPSDMIWLMPRIQPPFQYFQGTSNGLAAGVNRLDAQLGALYELVERDGWAISDFVRDRTGRWPPRVSLECLLPESIRWILDKLFDASVFPFVFDISTDLDIPTFSCALLDPSAASPGIFGGYGCSLDSEAALRRAITEACQARCAYISGARDDLFRRKFVLMKQMDSVKLLQIYNMIRTERAFSSFPCPEFYTIQEEWDALIARLTERGISELFSKVLYSCPQSSDTPEFTIVRMIAPNLQPPVWEFWTPGQRSFKALERFSASLAA